MRREYPSGTADDPLSGTQRARLRSDDMGGCVVRLAVGQAGSLALLRPSDPSLRKAPTEPSGITVRGGRRPSRVTRSALDRDHVRFNDGSPERRPPAPVNWLPESGLRVVTCPRRLPEVRRVLASPFPQVRSTTCPMNTPPSDAIRTVCERAVRDPLLRYGQFSAALGRQKQLLRRCRPAVWEGPSPGQTYLGHLRCGRCCLASLVSAAGVSKAPGRSYAFEVRRTCNRDSVQ